MPTLIINATVILIVVAIVCCFFSVFCYGIKMMAAANLIHDDVGFVKQKRKKTKTLKGKANKQ